LNQPETAAVAQKWGVELPDSLDAFYRSDAVARTEFILKPAGEPDGEGWYISGFVPLTIRDITEELAASKVPGIPLAHDAARGIYYLPFAALRRGESPVLLRNLERRSDTTVAPSFDEFTRLEAEQMIVDD